MMYLSDLIHKNNHELVKFNDCKANHIYVSVFNYCQKYGGTYDGHRYYNDYVVDVSENLFWDDLTDEEKQIVIERYICVREAEEGRSRDEINNDYPNYINADFVRACEFVRNDSDIDIII